MNEDEKRPRPSPRKKTIDKEEQPKSNGITSVPGWVTTFLIVIISLAWAASFVLGVINPNYQIPEQVNFLFSSVVGALFLNAATKRKEKDDE